MMLGSGSGAQAAQSCTINSLVVEATGTVLDAPPRLEVLLDGMTLGQFDIPGVPSAAATPEQSMAELKAAAARSTRLDIPAKGMPIPKMIEIRFLNDKWGGAENPGDRNLLIRSVTVNGIRASDAHIKVDSQSHGLTDADGTALYENGSMFVTGPFVTGCE